MAPDGVLQVLVIDFDEDINSGGPAMFRLHTSLNIHMKCGFVAVLVPEQPCLGKVVPDDPAGKKPAQGVLYLAFRIVA